MDKRGTIVQWIGADGGEPHDVAETETACPVGWASADTIWVSRRRGRKIVWTEVHADTGARPAGPCREPRLLPTPAPTPPRPSNAELRIVYDQTSQLRLVPNEHLARE